MAFEEEVAQRVRDVLGERADLVERKMFGGVAFMVQGNMAVGVLEDRLIVRVGVDDYERAIMEPHTRLFDLTGRPMTGWVMVVPEGYASDDDLRAWVEQGLDFALTLPPK
jgi:TfoX/Sxy family transcriptional regulator of competence genes